MENQRKMIELIENMEKLIKESNSIEEKKKAVNILYEVFNLDIYLKTYEQLKEKIISLNNNDFTETEFITKYDDMINYFNDFKEEYISNKDKKIKISFAIPSARLVYAKIAAEAILAYTDTEIEVVVSHNYEDEMTEIDKIQIDDERFKYFKREKTNQSEGIESFAYNLLNAISKCTGDYVFILSDKDIVNIEIIPHMILAIHNNRNVSAMKFIRGDEGYNFTGVYEVFIKGDEALYNAGISYIMTGLVYNRSQIDFSYLYNKIKEKEYGCRAYTHVYILDYLLKCGNFIYFLEPGCYRPDKNYPSLSSKDGIKIPFHKSDDFPYSLENRILAFKSFSNMMDKSFIDKNLYLEYIMAITNGYFKMVTVFMYKVYPEEHWDSINMRRNALKFRMEVKNHFLKIIDSEKMFDLINKQIKYSHIETIKIIEYGESKCKTGLDLYEEFIKGYIFKND